MEIYIYIFFPIYKCIKIKHIDFSSNSSGGTTPSSSGLTNGGTFRIKNVNSGLYMQVDGAKQADGRNVQQWGTTGDSVHDVWKLKDAGNGYFILYLK